MPEGRGFTATFGKPDKASEFLELERRSSRGAEVRFADHLAQLGFSRLKKKDHDAAEPLLRECLEIRTRMRRDDWQRFNSESLLGGCLLGQKQYASAEPLLLSGYEGLKARAAKIPSASRPRLDEAGTRLLQLYESWGKPEKVAEWREKLGLYELPEDPFVP
jgi:hypothetical protein